MTPQTHAGFTIKGLSIRTNNATEMTDKGQIGSLWQDFFTRIAPQLQDNPSIYGVYCHYESDAQGDFDVIAATDQAALAGDDLVSLTIDKGEYIAFPVAGEMPQAIINGWHQVWQYFSPSHCPHQRAYTADFEQYTSPTSAIIYIAIE